MQVFAKLFWGFDPDYWPIVSFSHAGSLNSLMEQSKPGDLMAFVGTQGEETAETERGKLLGLAEFGRKRIHSREALRPEAFAAAEKGPTGDIKWPHAVLITRAWRFIVPPLASATIGRLPMAAMSNAVLLSPEQRSAILALDREEIDVAQTKAIWDEREQIAAEVGPGGTMGPIPTSFLTTTHRDALQPASTYAFQFGSRNVWKIGWANDPAKRLEDLNRHVPFEILKEKWGNGWIQKWATAGQAYAMEQKILNSFDASLRYGERIHCTAQELEIVWRKAWMGK